MECDLTKNKEICTCTYSPCPRKGKCCECVIYHRKKDEIPGCFFTPEGEKKYDRSVQHYLEDQS